jgi:tRNA A37 methylthiotransferase MiaB
VQVSVFLLIGSSYDNIYFVCIRHLIRSSAHSELMRDSVDEATKQRRLSEVIEVFRSRLREKNVLQESGALRLVLLEGLSTRSDAMLTGRTDGNKRVLFPAASVLTSLDRLKVAIGFLTLVCIIKSLLRLTIDLEEGHSSGR